MDEFFSRSFDESNYTCWDFALEVWAHLTGQQMPRVLEAFNPEAMRSALDQCKVTFKPIPAYVPVKQAGQGFQKVSYYTC
jgi:1-deoxy-D-xylulose 5-phosphate reductoisomerase